MKSLFPELDEVNASPLLAITNTARSWCDPSQHCEVVGIDFGSKYAHYYMARSGKKGRMPFKELLAWLVRLPCNTLVVCESAHLVPQNEFSLAQFYTAEQLEKLRATLESDNITLKLASEAHTGKRMRDWVAHHYPNLIPAGKKSDAADALALAIYVDRCNDISLANPHTSFCHSPRRQFGRKVTKSSNAILNAARTDDYRGQFCPLIMKLAIKVKQRHNFPSTKFVLTVASTLMSEHEGRLVVLQHRGQCPGRWFWMRNVLRMSPWHRRGGTARSNLMWHTFRPYLQRRAKKVGLSIKEGGKYKKFAAYNPQEKALRTSAIKEFRQMLLRCRDECLKQARSVNAGSLELTDIAAEVTHGW